MNAVFRRRIFHWCLRAGLQRADATDISQEVLTVVFLRLDDFRGKPGTKNFVAWLWTITHNKIKDLARKQRLDQAARTLAGQAPIMLPSWLDAEEPDLAADSLRQRAWELAQSYSDKPACKIFLQVAVEGADPRELASALGFSVNAVYLAKTRFAKRLRKEIAQTDARK
jgi:RNA polymerase sigma-70 factor (ECF subfamily)